MYPEVKHFIPKCRCCTADLSIYIQYLNFSDFNLEFNK